MKVTFSYKKRVAKDIYSFYFKPPTPVRYTAGQFIELHIPHNNADERGTKHWFTLSSSPHEDHLTVTTKFSKPSSSFKQSLLKLSPGTELFMAESMGDFVIPKDPTIPLIFVAGGIGITPYRSMISWLDSQNEKRDITLIYAVTLKNQLAFLPLLKRYNLKLIEHTGNSLSAGTILSLSRPKPSSLIYLSGPEPMVETLVEQFKQSSQDMSKIVTDYFPGYKVL